MLIFRSFCVVCAFVRVSFCVCACAFLWWCGCVFVVVWLCVFVVVWLCFCVFVVVFLWWRGCVCVCVCVCVERLKRRKTSTFGSGCRLIIEFDLRFSPSSLMK